MVLALSSRIIECFVCPQNSDAQICDLGRGVGWPQRRRASKYEEVLGVRCRECQGL